MPSLSTYLKRSNFTKMRMTRMVKKPNSKNELKIQNWDNSGSRKIRIIFMQQPNIFSVLSELNVSEFQYCVFANLAKVVDVY